MHSVHGIVVVFEHTLAVFGTELVERGAQRLARYIVHERLEIRGLCKASGCQRQGQ